MSLASSGADFLAQASAALADSLDLETTLNTVARLAVPGIADSCAIHLLDERDVIRLVAAVHVDPLKAGAMQTLADPATAAPTRTWVRTIREGTSALLADINEETIRESLKGDDRLVAVFDEASRPTSCRISSSGSVKPTPCMRLGREPRYVADPRRQA